MDELPIRTNVLIFSGENFKPYITLRRKIKEQKLLQRIIVAAIEGKPLVILPQFTDKLKALDRMHKAGIVYFDKDKKQWLLNNIK